MDPTKKKPSLQNLGNLDYTKFGPHFAHLNDPKVLEAEKKQKKVSMTPFRFCALPLSSISAGHVKAMIDALKGTPDLKKIEPKTLFLLYMRIIAAGAANKVSLDPINEKLEPEAKNGDLIIPYLFLHAMRLQPLDIPLPPVSTPRLKVLLYYYAGVNLFLLKQYPKCTFYFVQCVISKEDDMFAGSCGYLSLSAFMSHLNLEVFDQIFFPKIILPDNVKLFWDLELELKKENLLPLFQRFFKEIQTERLNRVIAEYGRTSTRVPVATLQKQFPDGNINESLKVVEDELGIKCTLTGDHVRFDGYSLAPRIDFHIEELRALAQAT